MSIVSDVRRSRKYRRIREIEEKQVELSEQRQAIIEEQKELQDEYQALRKKYPEWVAMDKQLTDERRGRG